jgi:hypothetical protein
LKRPRVASPKSQLDKDCEELGRRTDQRSLEGHASSISRAIDLIGDRTGL